VESDENHDPASRYDAEARGIAVACGMAPRTFARGFSTFWRFDERGPWLGRPVSPPGEPSQAYIVDPWGGEEPRPVPGWPIGFVDDRLLFGDSSSEGLTLWRVSLGPEFDIEPVAVELPPHPGHTSRWISLSPPTGTYDSGDVATLLAELVGDAGETMVVGLDPRTRETLFVQEGMRVVDAKMGGRFVVMVDAPTSHPSRAVVLDTREPGRRLELPSGWSCCSGSVDLVTANRSVDGQSVETHLVSLPSFREVRLDGSWSAEFVMGAAGGGRHVLIGDEGIHLLEPDDAVPRLLHDGHGRIRVLGESAWLAGTRRYGLVEIQLDGSGAEVVFEQPGSSFVPLIGDRWAVVRDDGGSWDLRVLDRSTGHEEVIVEDVEPDVSAWNWRGPGDPRLAPLMALDAPLDDIVFGRREGDRLSLWRVVP
jgi:hypothetical protein